MEKYHVLVVEDDKEIRDGIEIYLKSQGYENIYIQYDCTVKMPRDYIPYVFLMLR